MHRFDCSIIRAVSDAEVLSSSSSSTPSHGQKPPVGPARRQRVGTGRVLPTPPVAKTSPRSPGKSGSAAGEISWECNREPQSPDSSSDSGRHRATVTFDSGSGGTFTVSFDAPQRDAQGKVVVQSEGHPSNEEMLSSARTSEFSSDTSTVFSRGVPSSSVVSGASLGTDILLNNTSTVVQALADRNKKKTVIVQGGDYGASLPQSDLFVPIPADRDSDTDSSLTGSRGRTYPSPQLQRKSLGRQPVQKSQSVTDRSATRGSSTRSGSKERNLHRSYSRGEQVARGGTHGAQQPSHKPPGGYRRAKSAGTVRDASSESETGSIISSSTEYSESSPKPGRRSFGGKTTPISQTKTNRAFALRRARTDSDTQRSDTSTLTGHSGRSRPSSAGTDTPTSPKVTPRSSGRSSARSRSTSRTRPTSTQDSARSTQRSDISLGQKIVDKSRENVRHDKKQADLQRRDGGRHSLRGTKSTSALPATQPAGRTRGGSTSDSKDASRVGTSQNARSLVVTGQSSRTQQGNRPQSNSRSNSPKTQEFNAWQRRKQYDPRKAVAESKKPKTTHRSKSTTAVEDANVPDKRGRVHSTGEDSSYFDGLGDSVQSEDIIKLSAEIVHNLGKLSREEGELFLVRIDPEAILKISMNA